MHIPVVNRRHIRRHFLLCILNPPHSDKWWFFLITKDINVSPVGHLQRCFYMSGILTVERSRLAFYSVALFKKHRTFSLTHSASAHGSGSFCFLGMGGCGRKISRGMISELAKLKKGIRGWSKQRRTDLETAVDKTPEGLRLKITCQVVKGLVSCQGLFLGLPYKNSLCSLRLGISEIPSPPTSL